MKRRIKFPRAGLAGIFVGESKKPRSDRWLRPSIESPPFKCSTIDIYQVVGVCQGGKMGVKLLILESR